MDLQPEENAPLISPPPPEASPAEVRAYFASILVNHHDVSAVEAQHLVAPWGNGKGEQINTFSQETYERIFGLDIGRLLYFHHFPPPSDGSLNKLGMDVQPRDYRTKEQRIGTRTIICKSGTTLGSGSLADKKYR